MNDPETMTEAEIRAEMKYRIQERLGMMCGTAEPTLEQIQIAKQEAEAWRHEFMSNENSTRG